MVPAIALIALLSFGLWVGNTAAWWVAVAVQIVGLLPFGSYGPLWRIASNLIALTLLLLPSARAFVFKPTARARQVNTSTP